LTSGPDTVVPIGLLVIRASHMLYGILATRWLI